MYSRTVEIRILNMIQKSVQSSLQMSQTPAIINWLKNYTDENKKKSAFETLMVYKRFISSNTDIFVTTHGNLNYYFNFKYLNTLSPSNNFDKWYFNTIKSDEKFNLNIDYNRSLKVTKLWVNVPVKENGKILGVIGTGEDISRFLDKVLKTEEKGTFPVLVDENALIKAHIDRELVEKKTMYDILDKNSDKEKLKNALMALKLKSKNAKTLFMQFKGDTYFVNAVYMKSIKWYLLFFVKTSELVGLYHFAPMLLTEIISFLAFFISVLLITNRIIIKPVGILTRTTNSIAGGNFDIRIDVTSDNELGKLSKTFNRMTATIKDYTENLEEKVRERTFELNEKNRFIIESINYAKTIQTALLPGEQDLKKIFAEYFVYWQPKDIVSGDFYWIYRNQDNSFLVAVIDCTGHNVPGAFMTVMTNSILNNIAERICNNNPAVINKELNRMIKETLKQDNPDSATDDGLDIGLCYCDISRGTLTFSGAKISLFYSNNSEIIEIKGDKQRIGYKNSDINYDYTNHEIALSKNSRFFISTDGFFDQNIGSELPFGKNYFINILKENSDKKLADLQKIFKDKTGKDVLNNDQKDDITIFGFKVNI